ncbi:MAG: hypothetical protein IPN34_18370 [Planctomycetes bacterium]|nr:hypothetical protein [Planctomycetota bacterium]
MKEEVKDALLIALVLDGKGGGRPLRGPEVQLRPREDGGVAWIHLDVDHSDASKLLAERSALPEDLREALLASETRPRAHHEGAGLFLIIRGINLNPGEEPDDMVSLRLWLEPGLVISARRQRIVATRDVEALLAKGKGPRNVGEFLVAILEILIRRIGELVNLLEEKATTCRSACSRAGARSCGPRSPRCVGKSSRSAAIWPRSARAWSPCCASRPRGSPRRSATTSPPWSSCTRATSKTCKRCTIA